jgi:hypothetical protein
MISDQSAEATPSALTMPGGSSVSPGGMADTLPRSTEIPTRIEGKLFRSLFDRQLILQDLLPFHFFYTPLSQLVRLNNTT